VSATVAPPPAELVARPPEAPKPTIRPATGAALLPVALARAVAFLALSAWGALHWMSMLEPAEANRGWTVVGVGVLAVAAMYGAGRLDGRRRVLAAVGSIVPLTALMLLAGRVPDELIPPGGWSELAGGISRGISDLPGVRVPYRGLDEWVRTIIPLGGSALVLAAALLAFWPRRTRLGFPGIALVVLIVLYVVPVVAMDFNVEFLRGALFTLLMVAFLRLEKLRRPDSLAAGALVLIATLVALVAAPILNRDTPWFDYETWALESSSSKSTSFTWDHSYGGLNWPRDGRELIRVRAEKAAYWKAENLDEFDGKVWRRSQSQIPVDEYPIERPRVVKRYTQRIKVSIRNLRTDQFITAGYASDIEIPRLNDIQTLDGLYVAPRTLRRGDAYTATVYTPKPNESQRRGASVDYLPNLANYTSINTEVQGVPGASFVNMTFPFFGTNPEKIQQGPPATAPALDVLARAGLSRTYALSREFAKGSRTPEDYVERVLAHLSTDDYTSPEVPPKSASTLDGFLFDAKAGYCQQYSGAMALLLRMAGIPARVVTGFSTGATDTKTGEYIVRDFDAHSCGANVPITADPAPWWRIPAIVAAVLLPLVAGWFAVRRWQRGAPPALSELERALRRTRREPAPGTTLHALESRFARTPAAAGYVRALRESRYRDTPAHPTRAQRRGLRSELARGGGLSGRLRAWWALPPR
jgi:transglutaminase-like putative cysteine protease